MAGSSVIGALRVNLGLDSAAFSAGVAQVRTKAGQLAADLNKRLGKLGDIPGLQQLQSTLRGISANAGAAFGAMGASASVALGAMSVSAINTAKDIQNLSRLANATPEEFQRMAYAAAQVGISQEKFSDILKDVNDRVGDFIATGGGPMADFFERIAPKVGVTAEQFRKLSGPQALQLYVDSLEKAGVNQQDFTFFMEAMASDSTALVPILRNGGKAAREFGDRLVALGGVMSNETVDRLASMKTALGEVGVVLRSVKDTMGAAFAPVVEALARTFTSLMTKGSALRLIFDGIASVAGWVANVFSAVVNIISHVVAGIWQLIQVTASWINSATGIGDAIKTIWNWSIGWVADILIGFSQAISALGGIGGAFQGLKAISAEVWERMRAGAEGVEEFFNAAAYGLAAAFTTAFGKVVSAFATLTGILADGWNALMASMGVESNAKGIGAGLAKSLEEDAQIYADIASSSLTIGKHKLGLVAEPLKSVAAINEKIAAGAAEAGAALGDAPGGLGAGLDAAGGKAGGAKAKLSAFQTAMKSLNEEAAKLRATLFMGDLEAGIWDKQKEAGVGADSTQGKEIAGIMTQIDGMKRLKEATDSWKDSIKSAFSSFITQGGSFKKVIAELIGKLAEMVMSAGFDTLWGSLGGSNLFGGMFKALGIGSYDGGGYTWNGPRTGGLDGKGGRLAMLHPQETVLDHTRGQGMGGGAARVEVVPSEYFDVRVTSIADQSAAKMGAKVRAGVRDQIQTYQRQPRMVTR